VSALSRPQEIIDAVTLVKTIHRSVNMIYCFIEGLVTFGFGNLNRRAEENTSTVAFKLRDKIKPLGPGSSDDDRAAGEWLELVCGSTGTDRFSEEARLDCAAQPYALLRRLSRIESDPANMEQS